jgi:hypothetical protein
MRIFGIEKMSCHLEQVWIGFVEIWVVVWRKFEF